MKKNIITITGDLGSGKSTTADFVAKELGYQRFSSGLLMRKMAEKQGLSIVELNSLAETDITIDQAIDSEIRRIGEGADKLVIDSRIAWHWIPESFKVYLTLDTNVAAQRVFNSLQKPGYRNRTEEATSVHDVQEKIRVRTASEQKRFMERYGIDLGDTSRFDLVLDTGTNSPKQIAADVIDNYKKWRQQR